MKKTLCIGFSGVIHNQDPNKKGLGDPVSGAFEWLTDLVESDRFIVCIYSTRSRSTEGVEEMQKWMIDHELPADILGRIRFPFEKPDAHLFIDDRAMMFAGEYPSVDVIERFRPWNKEQMMVCDIREERDLDTVVKAWYEYRPTSLEDLYQFMRSLQDDYFHDYGTQCHSIAAAAIAAARAMHDGSNGGAIDAGKSEIVMMEFIRHWRPNQVRIEC